MLCFVCTNAFDVSENQTEGIIHGFTFARDYAGSTPKPGKKIS